jgi:hypothetical protein
VQKKAQSTPSITTPSSNRSKREAPNDAIVIDESINRRSKRQASGENNCTDVTELSTVTVSGYGTQYYEIADCDNTANMCYQGERRWFKN